MKRRTLLLAAILCCLATSAAMADFSYSFAWPGDNVKVTALGNGKIFLRLNGELRQSRSGIILDDPAGNRFQLDNGGHRLVVNLAEGIFFRISVLPGSGKMTKVGWTKRPIKKGSVGDMYSPDTYEFGADRITNARHYEMVQQKVGKDEPEEFKNAFGSFRERRIDR